MRRNSQSHKARYQMVMVANDFQIPFHDEKALKLFLLFLQHEKPDWLVINGDFQDFWEISKYDIAPRAGKTFWEEIQMGRSILASFRRLLPQARITWIEGNHEFRLRQYLIRKAQALYDLPGLSVPELMRLDALDIEYVASKKVLSRFSDNYIRLGDLYIGHWDKVSKHAGYAAKNLVEEKGVSLIQGHTQRFGVHARRTIDGRILVGLENFCLCSMHPTYVSHPNWQLGFSVVYHQPATGRFDLHPILIRDYQFVWNHCLYTLKGVKRLRR